MRMALGNDYTKSLLIQYIVKSNKIVAQATNDDIISI